MTKHYRYGQLVVVGTGARKAINNRSFKDYLNDALSHCYACEGQGKLKNTYLLCTTCSGTGKLAN